MFRVRRPFQTGAGRAYTDAVARNQIRQLSPSLVNRIAAGEVIERPASVVKECVENAIDAGAKHITVEIDDGGKQLIRITDDGGGIPPEELPLAFASHATSKLRTDDDLFSISTMGFRGEALASIGSVSLARIASRVAEQAGAFEMHNRGGELSGVVATAGNVGTTVEIRELFFNVPARRKFLKGSGTESGHVSDAIEKIALARPEVSFKLVSAGRVTLDWPATTPTLRWLEAWPADHAQGHFELDSTYDAMRLRGLIALPELAQIHLKNQFIYVNGRCVRDKFIGHALKEAYRGLTEPGRNPAAILFLELPPDTVDVNVHPTKSEVRFRDSSRIHGLVLSAVREKLLAHDLVPRAIPQAVHGHSPFGATAAGDDRRQQLAAFFGASASPHSPAGGGYTGGTPASAWPSQPRNSDGPGGGHFLPEVPEMPEASPQGPTHFSPRFQLPGEIIPAIQLHNSYLVAQSDDGLVIIDQHALHERILFEELLQKVTRGPLESQRMLIPIIIRASATQIEALERLTPIFEKLGIEAHAIGPEAVAVGGFPSFLERLDPGEFVQDVLQRAEREEARLDHESLLHETLDMMSCKAAVKAGDPLTPQEIKALLEQRELTARASNCPHGRPTTLRMTLRDLEKQFKRTGF